MDLMNNITCERCTHFVGYRFDWRYAPEEFLEGKRSSKVWIVGLNPAWDIGENQVSTRDELENYFVPGQRFHRYFEDFRHVSEEIYNGFGREGGTAHTDIVKCGSKRFPGGRNGAELVHHCADYLKRQIMQYRPQLILCNGSPVSRYIQQEFPRNEDSGNTLTSYWTTGSRPDSPNPISALVLHTVIHEHDTGSALFSYGTRRYQEYTPVLPVNRKAFPDNVISRYVALRWLHSHVELVAEVIC